MSPLIALGLTALDAASQREDGVHFESLALMAQLQLLAQLEQGRLVLSRATGTEFLDLFMLLAAQAYLSARFLRPREGATV